MYYDERENINVIDELKYKEKNVYTENDENNFITNNLKNYSTDVNLNIDNININNFRENTNTTLYDTKDGFNKGNMFKSLYVPYKNYVYKVVVRGERDELLLKIQELTFKVKDLNLYLDIYPNNTTIYNEFKNTVSELKKHKDLYEKNYGPLCLDNTMYYSEYKWSTTSWPWINKGGNN